MTQPSATPNNGATAVITHRVRSDRHSEYELWLGEIAPASRAAVGHLDSHIIRPVPGVTETYTVIIRFDTVEHLQGWMASSERKRLIDQIRPLLAGSDDFYLSSGLDFWFTPAGAKARVPVRWKQYLITWSAIYPLALGVPFVLAPAFAWLGMPINLPLRTLAVTAVVVYLMVYGVMPYYTRLVQKWLFA